MPRDSQSWGGAAGLWVTAAGWAAAAERRFGNAWVVTPSRASSPAAALELASESPPALVRGSRFGWMPDMTRTAAKDVRTLLAARRWRDVGDDGPWADHELAFVWQHHDPWFGAAEPLASRRHTPLVLYVHAPQVWEAARWGVRRPGWGRLIEQFGERPHMQRADIVLCVSNEVAAEVLRIGANERRVLVSPMAVDPHFFSPSVSGTSVRERLGLGDRPVVGWAGSFRAFHRLEDAIRAFREVVKRQPDAMLLLVGGGSQRHSLEVLVDDLDLRSSVVFAGQVPPTEMPKYVAAMDVPLVVAQAGQAFHYSPLKLREYMSAGKAAVAPAIGEVARTIVDRDTGVLYSPGRLDELADAVSELIGNPALRRRIGEAARSYVLGEATWDVQLLRLLERLPQS
jgi:glycosyltransferase involved in cell wall biosynthesis